MLTFLIRLVTVVIAVQMLISCETTQSVSSTGAHHLIRDQRASTANDTLTNMADIDALIRLDNKLLTAQIKRVLQQQFSTTSKFNFQDISVRFSEQFISLQSRVNISDDNGNVVAATISGDILLAYSAGTLEWFPQINKLHISSKDFSFANGNYAESIPELDQQVLQILSTEVREILESHNYNAIVLDAVPLADISVGASLPNLNNTTATRSQSLKGVFLVADSVMLIEPKVTSIVLDLEFIPDLSTCPADITVSRAQFAHDVKDREPRNLVSNLDSSEDLQYFFSEISGAERPMTIIHYWFADGQPWVVEELAVGPSERWRTWSARGSATTPASHWRVLVVEKESGCILHSESLRTMEPENVGMQDSSDSFNGAFKQFSNNFRTKLDDFTISHKTPKVVLIEIRRPFFRDVLQASLTDLQIEATFDQNTLPPLQYSAQLLPFASNEIACENRNCPDPRVCTAPVARCKLLRDTRECTSCLFYNPLNNRCISQAEDPICEAARSRQNAKYDAERASCIAAIEADKLDCEQYNAQLNESCALESGAERSACTAVKQGIDSLQPDTPFAAVTSNPQITGHLSTLFSDFELDGDFIRLKQNITLKSNIEIQGELSFATGDVPAALSRCITAWNAPFNNRIVALTGLNSMLSPIEAGSNFLSTEWSGSVIPLTLTPSPLESVFVGNPELLANCSIGLTVDKVEQAMTGDEAGFFIGQIELELVPQPTIIQLKRAVLRYDGTTYSAEAALDGSFLLYEITK